MIEFPPGILKQHIAIVGKTGSGKSFTAKLLVEGLLEEKRRVCVIDPTGVWWGLRSSADGSAEGFPIAVIGGEHGDIELGEHAGAAVAELVAGDNFPCVIDVSEFSNAARTRFMTEFAEKVYTLNRQSLHLVIDEADEFAPQNPLPESKRMLGAIDRIVRRGRVRGFRVVMISQRPAVLHKNVLTQCNALVAMKLIAPQDRKALEEWIKGHDDTAGSKVLSTLAKLETGEGWLWAPDEHVLERTKFPRIRTFDSGRTPDDDEEIPEPKRLAAVDVSKIAAALNVEVEKPVLRNAASNEGEKQEVAKLRDELDTARDNIAELVGTVELLRTEVNAWRSLVYRAREIFDTELVDGRMTLDPPGGRRATVWAPIASEAQPARESQQPKQEVQNKTSNKVAPKRADPPSDLSGVAMRILNALAELEQMGAEAPDRELVAFMSGYSNLSSKGFANGIGSLRTSGFIDYPSQGVIALTDTGRSIAQPPARPLTSAELQARIIAMLGGATGRILEPLIAAYPRALPRETVAAKAGYGNLSSKGFANAIGRLRTLGFVSYPDRGTIAARPVLFLK